MKKYNKILVTGADGYIGSHLVEKLVADGCDVRAFVLYNSFNSWGWLDAIPQSTKDKIGGVDCDSIFVSCAPILCRNKRHGHIKYSYGPRQSTRAVIPTVITQIAAGQTDIQLGALTPTRDFSFVDDTVSGFITAMNNDAIIGQVTNIGSGFEISIGDTVDLIADIMGVDINVICDENRMRPEASEVNRLFADIKKAKDVMNWEPSYGGLDGFRRGMEKTVKWFSNPENLKHYKVGEYTI